MSKNSQEFAGLKKAISWYINKITTSNKKENDTLLRKLKDIRNDNSRRNEYLEIRDQLVLSNGGFAMKYVKIYYNTIRDDTVIADLFQEAMIGITEAIDAFDVDKNIAFTTYAYYHVKKRLIDFIRNCKLIKAPREMARNIKNVNDAMCYLLTKNEIEPTPSEIADLLKMSKGIELPVNVIDDIRQLLTLSSADSENAFITEYNEQVIIEEENKLFSRMASNIAESLKSLPLKTQKQIILRFGIGKEYPHCMEEIDYMLKDMENKDA